MTVVDVEAGTGAEQLVGGEAIPEGPVGRSLWVDAWRHFRRNRLAMVGLAFVVFITLVAIFAPLIAPHGISDRPFKPRQGIALERPFGSDQIGRDHFSRVIHGARTSVRIAFSAAAISLAIGVTLGAIAGFIGSLTETVIMRVVDIVLAVPYVILAVALATVVGRSENAVIIILGLLGWTSITRIVRASFLSLKEQEYVEAARALGFSRTRIVLRHMMPNALQPIIVFGTITIGTVVLSEAALSFLGVGPQEPTPAWGLMVASTKGLLPSAPHLPLFPGLAIFCMVLAFVFVGDGLRDALDPKLRGRS